MDQLSTVLRYYYYKTDSFPEKGSDNYVKEMSTTQRRKRSKLTQTLNELCKRDSL